MSLVEGVEAPFWGPLFYGRQEARLSDVYVLCVCVCVNVWRLNIQTP